LNRKKFSSRTRSSVYQREPEKSKFNKISALTLSFSQI